MIIRYDPAAEFFTSERCFINELFNTAADESLSIAQARIAPGVTTRWHTLIATTERYVILAGEGLIEIGELPAQLMTALDVAIIPPGCKQRITNSGTIDLIFLAICTPRFMPKVYVEMAHSE
ncbi:cupin domain-containing protein [Thiospirillum jenense]|uniref:Cupin domain-containing protein n=2 Tax=Thiospirillum jenense TaxID=1653858 RepID=A0A839HHM7_9GAMM|nr:cupin domain-containing protein [Thiospirillum jenense]